MNKVLSLIATVVAVSAIAGCASQIQPLQPGAEKVQLTKQTLPTTCQDLGQVMASTPQAYETHEHLEKDQINDLKNQAAKLGANVVAIKGHLTTHMQKHQALIAEHIMEGEAYSCPTSVLNKLLPQDAASLSDVTLSDA